MIGRLPGAWELASAKDRAEGRISFELFATLTLVAKDPVGLVAETITALSETLAGSASHGATDTVRSPISRAICTQRFISVKPWQLVCQSTPRW